jgi:WD40 repeat protein
VGIARMDKAEAAYTGEDPFVFVSYAHADESEVIPEISWLQSNGLRVWWDEGISGGSRWRDDIAERITHCQVLVFYVSPRSVQSTVCREELEYALAHDRSVVLVHLDDTTLPDGIKLAVSNRQALFRHQLSSDDYERKLLEALDKQIGEQAGARQIVPRPVKRNSMLRLAGLILFLSGAAIAVLLTWWFAKPDIAPAAPVARFQQILPPPYRFAGAGSTHLTINRAGTRLFALGRFTYPDRQVLMRSIGGFEFEPVPDTKLDNKLLGVIPSDDGQTLLLTLTGGALARVSANGGEIVPLGSSSNKLLRFHARWSGPQSVLLQDVTNIVELNWQGGEVRRRPIVEGGAHPFPLIDGETMLYSKLPDSASGARAQIVVRILETGEEKVLLEGFDPRLTPTGHLLFFLDGTVWAVRFDTDKLSVQGKPVKVLEDVYSAMGKAQYEFSDTGTMVYLPLFQREMALRWVSRQGLVRDIDIPPQFIQSVGLSPDGRTVALGGGGDVRLFSLANNLTTRLVLLEGGMESPVWLDEKTIVFTEYDFAGNYRVIRVDRVSKKKTRLVETKKAIRALEQLPNGRLLVERCDGFTVNCDIAELEMDTGDFSPVLASTANEKGASISPNGQFIAYSSDEFGPARIVIRPYPDVDSYYHQLPINGCTRAEWLANGDELFVECKDGRFVVPVRFDGGLETGEPALLPGNDARYFFATYSQSRQQFLVLGQENANNLFVVVMDWFDELDRLIAE